MKYMVQIILFFFLNIGSRLQEDKDKPLFELYYPKEFEDPADKENYITLKNKMKVMVEGNIKC